MFIREIEKNFFDWLNSDRRKPLIVRGARQVGKSTSIRSFAGKTDYQLIEINLEQHQHLNLVFESFDTNKILNELNLVSNTSIGSREKRQILFLDEIQATPACIAALRYLYEEKPHIPIIAAGSLLEFALSSSSYSMPVGRVEFRFMGPCSFEEFLLTCEETQVLDYIQNYKLTDQFSLGAHKKLLARLHEFLFIGGMPEAVQEFANSHDWEKVKAVQRSILQTYENDFLKYSTSAHMMRLRRVFEVAPRVVGQKAKFSLFSKEEKARDIRLAIDLLTSAQVLSQVRQTDANGLPLAAESDHDNFKLLFLDIGLLNRSLDISPQAFFKLDDAKLINSGPVAEQFVGQELLNLSKGLEKPLAHYWLREQRSGNAELDYVTAMNGIVIPVEVKSGKTGTLRSLHQFCYEKKCPLATRIDLNLPSIHKVVTPVKTKNSISKVSYKLLSIPAYLIGQFERLVSDFIENLDARW